MYLVRLEFNQLLSQRERDDHFCHAVHPVSGPSGLVTGTFAPPAPEEDHFETRKIIGYHRSKWFKMGVARLDSLARAF